MLPRLNPDPNALVDVQQTTFSHEFLGRWACSTWDEVRNNGGDPFDIVVIGAGMFGGYIAEKLYRRAENIGLRVLVVDAGAFLLPTHVQNLPRLTLTGPTEQVVAANTQDPGPQNLVWGHPWHSNQAFPGLAYCIGGRSLYWGGWSPRLTAVDLGPRPTGQATWPTNVANYLLANYEAVETEIGGTANYRLYFRIAIRKIERAVRKRHLGRPIGRGSAAGGAGQGSGIRPVPFRQVQQRLPALRCHTGRHRAALAEQHRCVAAPDATAAYSGRQPESIGQSSH